MAKGAADRGVRVAFGDGSKVIWDPRSEEIFRHNPNIAIPRERQAENVEWVPFYRGHRQYNRDGGDRWIWNYEFRCPPGEMFLSREERKFGEAYGKGFVLIEPNVPVFKKSSSNKDWGLLRYQEVANRLRREGYAIGQVIYGTGRRLTGTRHCSTPSFRLATSVMAQAALYIGPEGGLHHTAAAFGKPAVVIFGGWVPPATTGYAFHTNLTGGETEACGRFDPCGHCAACLDRISADEVVEAALRHLRT